MTTYLSKILQMHLHPSPHWQSNSNKLESDILHNRVMSLFPMLEQSQEDPGSKNAVGRQPRKDLGVLFRLDTISNGSPYYLIRSRISPEGKSELPIKTIEEPDHTYFSGKNVAFRISINAVTRDSQTRRMKPIPHDTFEDDSIFQRWFANKMSPFFQQVQIITHDRDVLDGKRDGNRRRINQAVMEKAPRRVVQIDYIDGVAKVTDGVKLQQALENGIGRAKSYGCGLLTVKVLDG